MEWKEIGARIREQREFMGFTRERFAEAIEVTPKFCSDIELGLKGMSVPTLCRIAQELHLTTDYILFGREESKDSSPALRILEQATGDEKEYAEQILKIFLMAMQKKKEE